MGIAFEIRRYAFLAATHILAGLSERELKRVRSVILFGSVAQGVATAESDVDIFFDVDAPKRMQRLLRSRLNKCAEQFYLTNIALEFKLRGIANELSITVGRLAEWAELARSISSTGIVLYGKYMTMPPGLKAWTILSWEKPGKAKGALLNKIYGYRAGKKRYPGMLERIRGIKVGRATIMVPAINRDAFVDVLEKYKISYSRYDIRA